jgi:hypothetical protein
MSIKVESITDTPENVAAVNAVVPVVEEVETPEIESDEPVEAVAQDAEAEETDEDDSDEEVDEQEAKPKKKSGYVRKLAKKDELIAAKDREIELLKQLADKGKEPEKAEPVKVADSDTTPDPDKFDTVAEYTRALFKYERAQEKKAEAQAKADEDAKAKQQELGASFNKRLETFKETTEDFDDVVQLGIKSPHKLDPNAQYALIESEYSAQIMYDLAKNLPELERISKLSPTQQIKELGKLETRYTTEPVKEVKKQSNAPAPITPIKAKGTTVTKSLSDPNLSQKEYEAIRRKQQQAKNA